MLWLTLALAKRPPPTSCDAEAVEAASTQAFPGIVESLGRACTPLRPSMLEWMLAHADGRRSPSASKACSRARHALKRDLSPDFVLEMKEVARVCKLSMVSPELASGPSALLLGEEVRSMLREAGIGADLAARVSDRFAGRTERLPGRYGSLAQWTDALELPVVSRAVVPVPVERVLSLEGGERPGKGALTLVAHHANSGIGLAHMVALEAPPEGLWIAARPDGAERGEYDRVVGIQVEPAAPSAVRIAVEPERIEVAYGTAGDMVDVDDAGLVEAVLRLRETLLNAQEFGREEPPPDRIWVQPVGEVSVQRVVMVLDALLDSDGNPRFAGVSVSVEGSLVEWPEEVDAAGLR